MNLKPLNEWFLFFIPALLRRAKKRGKNPHSKAVKKGANKNTLTPKA